SGCRREDKLTYAVGQHRLQQRERGSGIVAEELLRLAHRLAGFDRCREMENRIRTVLLDRCIQGATIRDVAHHQRHGLRDGLAMALAQVVVDRDVVSGGEQGAYCGRADVTRAPGDENVHASPYIWLSTRRAMFHWCDGASREAL